MGLVRVAAPQYGARSLGAGRGGAAEAATEAVMRL